MCLILTANAGPIRTARVGFKSVDDNGPAYESEFWSDWDYESGPKLITNLDIAMTKKLSLNTITNAGLL